MLRAAPLTALAVACLVLPSACASSESPTAATLATDSPSLATWVDTSPDVASLALVRGRVDLAGTRPERLTVKLRNARFTAIPDQCEPSTVVRRRSFTTGTELVCQVAAGASAVTFDAIVVGQQGAPVTGTAAFGDGDDPRREQLPTRTILGGSSDLTPDVRLISSPDFLNADVGDLADGPSRWTPARSTNSTNADYERALGRILDDWAGLDPAAVLVAGDLVDGRWGYDDQKTGNFGPVTTLPQARAALRRAARTYYPQWTDRFTERGLAPFPAIGDHEYGDNPWSDRKRLLADDFKREFAREFTQDAAGRPRFADHPPGPAATTAYAGRPTPDLQVVTLDVFDITPKRARIGLDRRQFTWLRGVLAKAKRDGVEWIVVQGHVPIAQPVRARGSSLLSYPGGTDSRLWKLFRRYDVDLYLAGEVHDTTAIERDGVVQISHGGLFQFGLTTALVLDFYGDGLYLTLRDYDVRHSDVGPRLWETRRGGMPSQISVEGDPMTIGSAIITQGRLVLPSGILEPLR